MTSPKTKNYATTRIILSIYMVLCLFGIGIGAIVLVYGVVKLVQFWIYGNDSGYAYAQGLSSSIEGISIMFAGCTSLILARLVIVLTDIAMTLKNRE